MAICRWSLVAALVGAIVALHFARNDGVLAHYEVIEKIVLQSVFSCNSIKFVIGSIVAVAIGYTLSMSMRASKIPLVRVDLTPPAPKNKSTSATMDLKDPKRDGFIQCWNPSFGSYLGEIPVTTPAEVKNVIQRAREAQQKWIKTSFDERRRVLKILDKCLLAHRDEICKLSSMDTGKTQLEALLGEIMVTSGKIEWICQYGEDCLKPENRSTPLVMSHKTARVEWHPLGVLGVIAPWNYPFHNLYNHIISGIFTGNGVVMKVSEFSAWCGAIYMRVIQEVLKSTGHDPNLVALVQGFGETGAALVNGGVDKVIFTGSPGIGKHVMRGAADTLTPVVLELGGKDPFIVTENADINQVVQIALRGAYQNCGQNCVGAERFYVYESVHDEFVRRVCEIVPTLKQGPPVLENGSWNYVDVGATTTYPQLQHVKEMVDDAIKNGARAVCGGKINTSKELSGGLFFEPTVLVDVKQDMYIANEEVFGPVMTIIKVPNDDDEAAIKMINSTSYGLGSSIFAKNVKRANRLASKIYTGMTTVNDFGVGYLVQDLPFGGVKVSGFNRFAGKEGLRECCLMKSAVSDRFGCLGVRTSIPPKLGYPMQGQPTIDFANGLMDFQYAPTLWGKIQGIMKLV